MKEEGKHIKIMSLSTFATCFRVFVVVVGFFLLVFNKLYLNIF